MQIDFDLKGLKNFIKSMKIIAHYGPQVCIYAHGGAVFFYSLHVSNISFVEIEYSGQKSKDTSSLCPFTIPSETFLNHLDVVEYMTQKHDQKLPTIYEHLNKLMFSATIENNTLSITVAVKNFISTFCLSGEEIYIMKLGVRCMEKEYAAWKVSANTLKILLTTFQAPHWEIKILEKNNVDIKGQTENKDQLFLLRYFNQQTKGKKQSAVLTSKYVALFIEKLDSKDEVEIRIGPNCPIEIYYKNVVGFIAPITNDDDGDEDGKK